MALQQPLEMLRVASLSSASLLGLGALAAAQVNKNACPLLGASFPINSNIDTATLKPAGDAFNIALEEALAAGGNKYGTFNPANLSFSINVWSTNQNTSLYEYHYEGTNLAGAVTGDHTLDGDTLYRTGSISKLHTVYTYLAAVGEAHLDEPITKFIPELAAIDARRNGSDLEADTIHWKDITLRALATQMSGLPRDFGLGDVASLSNDSALFEGLGLPQPNNIPYPACVPFTTDGKNLSCTRQDFFDGMSSQSPVWTPYRQASYSNPTYGLLSWALEAILNDGREFRQIFKDVLTEPLGLHRTFYDLKNVSQPVDNAMIPYDVATAEWLLEGWFDDAAGAVYSTANDLAELGRSILRSDLVPKPITNQWLKPATFTADPDIAVGMPWEIYRTTVPVSPGSSTTRVVDMYTKAGDVGLYSSMLALVPDYEMGFTVLVAGGAPTKGLQRVFLAEMLRDHFLPVFEQLNGQGAEKQFAGHYRDATTNSSITVALSPDLPGLGVVSWISRGVDMLAENSMFRAALYNSPTGHFAARLQPTANRPIGGKISFRMVVSTSRFPEGNLWECFNWAFVESVSYGMKGLDHLVFDVDDEGRAKSVDLRGFRTVLSRHVCPET